MTTAQATPPADPPILTDANRETLTDAVRTRGLHVVARTLGTAREPIARVMARLPVRDGTAHLLHARIAERLTPPQAA